MTFRFTIPGAPRTKKNNPRPGMYAGRFRIFPSKAARKWFDQAMTHVPEIRRAAREQGIRLPIEGPVNVAAKFYRDRRTGDACGYYQALGDFLQAPRARPKRNGAGVLQDDAQIATWDGSVPLVDPAHPRIEVEITLLGEQQERMEFG